MKHIAFVAACLTLWTAFPVWAQGGGFGEEFTKGVQEGIKEKAAREAEKWKSDIQRLKEYSRQMKEWAKRMRETKNIAKARKLLQKGIETFLRLGGKEAGKAATGPLIGAGITAAETIAEAIAIKTTKEDTLDYIDDLSSIMSTNLAGFKKLSAMDPPDPDAPEIRQNLTEANQALQGAIDASSAEYQKEQDKLTPWMFFENLLPFELSQQPSSPFGSVRSVFDKLRKETPHEQIMAAGDAGTQIRLVDEVEISLAPGSHVNLSIMDLTCLRPDLPTPEGTRFEISPEYLPAGVTATVHETGLVPTLKMTIESSGSGPAMLRLPAGALGVKEGFVPLDGLGIPPELPSALDALRVEVAVRAAEGDPFISTNPDWWDWIVPQLILMQHLNDWDDKLTHSYVQKLIEPQLPESERPNADVLAQEVQRVAQDVFNTVRDQPAIPGLYHALLPKKMQTLPF